MTGSFVWLRCVVVVDSSVQVMQRVMKRVPILGMRYGFKNNILKLRILKESFGSYFHVIYLVTYLCLRVRKSDVTNSR